MLGHGLAAMVLHRAAAGWQVGQRVTGNPLITCGRCEVSLQGRDKLCDQRTLVCMQLRSSTALIT